MFIYCYFNRIQLIDTCIFRKKKIILINDYVDYNKKLNCIHKFRLKKYKKKSNSQIR